MQERNVAGITCGAVLAALSDYVDGELSAEARARVDAHLAGCDVCERFGGRFAGVIASLRQRRAEPPLSDERLRALDDLLDEPA